MSGGSLLNGVPSRSKARGASEVMVHATFGIDVAGVHRFMKRRGIGVVGGIMVRKTHGTI
jgi:hypothetical protein